MIYKDANVTYDINSRRSDGRATNIQFMTQDTGSAKLSFSFTKDGVPLPLSAVDTKIVLLYSDGSFYKKSLTIIDKVNGKAEYILSDEELKHYGIVKAELKLYYTNGQALATSFFTFTISKTLEDQNIVPVAEYYIDDFETLRNGINQTVDEISRTVEELREKFADLEAIETKEGAQEKADIAEKNAKDYTDEHANDQIKHITAKERETWNAKETPSGAQEKVNAHANKTDIHVTQSDKDKWNAAQLFKMTLDNGVAKYHSGVDFNTVVETGLYYMSGAKTELNAPVNNNGYLIVNNYGTYPLQEYVTYSSSDTTSSGRRKFMRNKVASSDSWTSWREIESVEGSQAKVDVHANKTDIHVTPDEKSSWNDLISQFRQHNYNQERHTSAIERAKWNGAVTYANITLKNGATAGTRTPIYAKWGPLTLLRGHVKTEPEIIFGSIPSSYAPIGGAIETVPLSGTGGTANLIVYENGDLKIKYPDPTDSSKLGGGYYIDVVIGFQEGGTA
ncbi:BppU family phage baseplate upper protein [Bacillus subtilis]|uniref:BppU family phage baseplate upper protein n=2 Tax=Bacillus subtilis TaxID=1423 RepID=UPI001BDBA731